MECIRLLYTALDLRAFFFTASIPPSTPQSSMCVVPLSFLRIFQEVHFSITFEIIKLKALNYLGIPEEFFFPKVLIEFATILFLFYILDLWP